MTGKAQGTVDPITSAQLPRLDEVHTWLQKMIAALKFAELVVAIVALIRRMSDFNTELTKQLANLRRKRPRSERLEWVERQLAFAFPGLVTSAHKPGTDESKTREKKSRRGIHPGRAPLPPHLPRVEVCNPVPAALRICPQCGSEMTTVGHSVCEILEIEPARVFVLKRMDERVACPYDDTIVSAPTPPQIVERGKLGTTLIVESLADKVLEHQPIERQCTRHSRAGADIAPQTLGHSVAAAIDLLAPIARSIDDQTRAGSLLATDSTGIPVLDKDVPEGIRTGTVWCWMADRRWVSFAYSALGDSDGVRRFLGDELRRTVQCDGTSLLSFLERKGGKRPGCWAHGRRYLIVAARGGDVLALEGVRIIRRLFAVERLSAMAGDTAEQRRARRAEHSVPALAELRAWVDANRGVIPKKTPLGKALNYLNNQWKRLVLFLENGGIELTNNDVERQLRRLVLGRRNWLFTWGDLGGKRTAIMLTIVGTCIAQRVNPRAYLHVVTRLLLGGWPMKNLRELLPDRICATHPALRLPAPRPPQILPAPK